jgi:hypothetical protein
MSLGFAPISSTPIAALSGGNVVLALTSASATGKTLGTAYVPPGAHSAHLFFTPSGYTPPSATAANFAHAYYTALGVRIALPLTGVAAAGAVGGISTASSGAAALTGVSSTRGVGSMSVTVSVVLAGASSTSGVGSTSATASVALTGAGSTSGVGSTSAAASVALTGAQSLSAVGDLASTQALGGVAASGAVGDTSPAQGGTVALTGVESSGAVGAVDVELGLALAAVESTGAAGDASLADGLTLTGVQLSAAAGAVACRTLLTGVASALTAGEVQGQLTLALAGVESAGAASNLAYSDTISGQADMLGHAAIGVAGGLASSFALALAGVGMAGDVAAAAADNLPSVTGTLCVLDSGTLSPAFQQFMAGVAALDAVGSLGAAPALALSGMDATGAVGFTFAGTLAPGAGTAFVIVRAVEVFATAYPPECTARLRGLGSLVTQSPVTRTVMGQASEALLAILDEEVYVNA